MIKILHCADIHLDAPFTAHESNKAEARRTELRGTFSSMMLWAKTNGIDIMLMAGDIFDCDYATKETIALALREFAANPRCRFIISPGNHDPFTESGLYAKTAFPENVYIFSKESLEKLSFDDVGDDHEKVDVYGYAFRSSRLDFNPFAGKNPDDDGRINLVCAHGEYNNPLSDKCPIMPAEIRDSGFDYIALGHVHNPQAVEKLGITSFGYSGCLEGRDFGECGHKGAIYAEISKEEGRADINVRHVRFSKRRYESDKLDVTGASDTDDLIARVKGLFSEKKYGTDTLLRITLTGDVSPELRINTAELESVFAEQLFTLEIRDATVPLFNAKLLESDPTIRGAVYNRLLPMLRDGSPEERRRAAAALRVALAALSGSDFQ